MLSSAYNLATDAPEASAWGGMEPVSLFADKSLAKLIVSSL